MNAWRRTIAKRSVVSSKVVTMSIAAAVLAAISVLHAKPLKLEKQQIKIGFIKLTDMVPLAVAYEKGYFEDEGLYVTLEPQANWKVVLDRVITGELDASHMLAGQPLGATIGVRHEGRHHHGLQHGPQRQCRHGFRTQSGSRCSRSCPKDAQGKPLRPVKADGAQAGRRRAFARPASRFAWAWCSRYQPTTTSCGTGLPPAACTRLLFAERHDSGQIRADVQLSVTPPPQMPATHGGRDD